MHRLIIVGLGLPLVQRILNSTVSSFTGYAPAELLYGGSVSLNRGLIKENCSKELLVKCPEYVQNLYKFQSDAIAASQRSLAGVHDGRVEKAVGKSKGALKGYGASKLDYKWKGPYRVIKNTGANIYQCADL